MVLPDGPRSAAPFQMMQWLGRPLDFLERCHARYGDTFTVNLGVVPPSVFLCHPEALAALFAPDAASRFDSGRGNAVLSVTLGERSLIVLDGEHHQNLRRLVMPPFHGERLRAFGETIATIAQKSFARWQPGRAALVRPTLARITMEVILQVVFGLSEGERLQRLRSRLGWLLDVTSAPLWVGASILLPQDLGPWSPRGQLKAELAEIDRLIYAEIGERRRAGRLEGNDMLTMMMLARDESGEPLSDVELRDQLMTLLVAGHETTATTLAWALALVHKHPPVRERLLAELAATDGDPQQRMNLPYLNAVCQETMRLFPVAMLAFPRIPKEPITLQGRTYPAGTVLMPCIYLAHRRPEVFPDPTRFQPERFLGRQYSPYEFLPFGGGHRRCIGLAFSLYEMKIILAELLTTLELALPEREDVRPVRRGVTLSPPGSLRLAVLSRRSAAPQPALSRR